MRLTEAEFQAVRAQGLYITDKCDACGWILNQSYRYTILDKPEVYCTANCRDEVFLGAKAQRVRDGERCFRCHQWKAAGSLYCAKCRPHADPRGQDKVAAADLKCAVCDELVPVLRKSKGSETCSKKCKERLKKRRQREEPLPAMV
jgi:hypothetical protein